MSEKLRAAALAVLEMLSEDDRNAEKCIRILGAALVEPKQKPVACIKTNGELMWLKKPSTIYSKPRPLYTAPPRKEWVGLTAEDMADAHNSTNGDVMMRLAGFARAIEAKLREKNT